MTEYTLYFDGGSNNNPGRSSSGSVIYNEDNVEIWAESYYVGDYETNNTAEYYGLIKGLEYAVNHNITSLTVKGDSSLIINQVIGKYKVNSPHLIVLHRQVMELVSHFENITFAHILRKYNKRADELSRIGRNL
jgi:ribonuclease HI